MENHKFSDEEIAEFKDAFELFDRTGDGIIPYSECANLARCFGYDPLESTVRKLLGSDGEEVSKKDMEEKTISFDDYLGVLWGISQTPSPGNLEDFHECLKAFDKDGNGFVSVGDIRRLMCGLGERMSEKDVEFLLEGVANSAEMVKYDDFIAEITSDKENWQE